MAIQLPYTREDDMMMGVVNRVAQRRFAMQERHDQNQRYADAKAQAEQAFAWDKEKFEVMRQEARAERAQRSMALQAQQRANDLAYRQQEFQFGQQLSLEHAGTYFGKMAGALNSTYHDLGGKRFGNLAHVSAIYKNNKGEIKYDDTALKMRPFRDDKKELWWQDYAEDAVRNKVKPSRAKFEEMYALAEAQQDSRIYSVMKDWGSRVPSDIWKKTVRGNEYDSFVRKVNAQAQDPTQMLQPTGGLVEDDSGFGWAKPVGVSIGAAGSGYGAFSAGRRLVNEFRGIPKIAAELMGNGTPEGMTAAKAWASKASPSGVSKAAKIVGLDGTASIDDVLTKMASANKDDVIRAASKLGASMSKSGVWSLIKSMPKNRFTFPVIAALAAAAGVAWSAKEVIDLFSDEE